MLYLQDVFTALHTGMKLKMDLIVQFHRLVQTFYLIQHLFPAFCTLNAFFPVEGFQFCDDLLLMLNFLLLIHPCFQLGITQHCFFLCIIRIIAEKYSSFSVIQFHDLSNYFI